MHNEEAPNLQNRQPAPCRRGRSVHDLRRGNAEKGRVMERTRMRLPALVVMASIAVVLSSGFLPPAEPPETARGADGEVKSARVERPPGRGGRPLWTTSRITGSPEPPPPYRVERAFPGLKFVNPVELTAAPGTDRLFLAEQSGKIYSFPNDPSMCPARPVLRPGHGTPGAGEGARGQGAGRGLRPDVPPPVRGERILLHLLRRWTRRRGASCSRWARASRASGCSRRTRRASTRRARRS